LIGNCGRKDNNCTGSEGSNQKKGRAGCMVKDGSRRINAKDVLDRKGNLAAETPRRLSQKRK